MTAVAGGRSGAKLPRCRSSLNARLRRKATSDLCPSLVPVARASGEMIAPRLPPSLTPRAFAAASAALVRLEISPASSSATEAICWSIKRPVGPSICGRSANRTSTPASKSRDRNATDRVRRSTLATMIGTRCSRAAANGRRTVAARMATVYEDYDKAAADQYLKAR
jgi:hypothetical protein